ncbi:hypothetical protein Noca_2218 [Nocardioides sp. JS614]|nr:hypothetical protein Noca_2218 [Nocardioides sp. JS614]
MRVVHAADRTPDGSLRRLLVTTRLIYLTPVVLAALLLTGCGGADGPDDDGAASPPTSAGQVEADATAMPPWPAPVDDVPARVEAAGLDLGPMGTAEHYHPRLEIIIGGKPVQLPANIGVDPSTGAMSAVHTHETDGTIHIEADTVGEVFTLGQLFTQWGVQLTSTQIGGVKAEPGEKVVVTSNGTQVPGDPRELRLEPEQVIVLRLP